LSTWFLASISFQPASSEHLYSFNKLNAISHLIVACRSKLLAIATQDMCIRAMILLGEIALSLLLVLSYTYTNCMFNDLIGDLSSNSYIFRVTAPKQHALRAYTTEQYKTLVSRDTDRKPSQHIHFSNSTCKFLVASFKRCKFAELVPLTRLG
jgi:hypothetical protein